MLFVMNYCCVCVCVYIRGRAHCKILHKYCIFSGAVRILATSLRHRTQNDNTD